MASPRITEHKRHKNKPDEQYDCIAIHREPGYVVLRYDVDGNYHIGPFPIPRGSLTIAHYREDVPHVLWEMYGPQRELIGYCYHLSIPPVIADDTVDYLDLLLDLWFAPDGTLTVLDEDELEQADREGKINPREREIIAAERVHIIERHPEILRELWGPPGGVGNLQ